jgi:hypothetical protein
MQRIAQNGGMFQQMLMMQQQMLDMAQHLDALQGSNMAQMMAQEMGGAPIPTGDGFNPKETAALGGENKESGVTKNARKRVAESTSPT